MTRSINDIGRTRLLTNGEYSKANSGDDRHHHTPQIGGISSQELPSVCPFFHR